MYIIAENGHAIVIDPCKDILPATSLNVDLLLVTHEHYDHISGVNEWKSATGAKLLCSKTCAANIKNPSKNMSRYFDAFCEMQSWMKLDDLRIKPEEYICKADKVFEDQISFTWQGHKVKLQEIPGHSAGSIGIFIDESDFFSGDSVLKDYEVELRLPGGNLKKWEEIGRKRIEHIQNGTRIWPGHFECFIFTKR